MARREDDVNDCPECGADAWANNGNGFRCVECGYADVYDGEDDEPEQTLCDGTCDTCNCAPAVWCARRAS